MYESSCALFLPKLIVPLVEKKLKSGIRVRDHVPSYGDRKNDVQTAAQCKLLVNLFYR
jgi:hypothetical protein